MKTSFDDALQRSGLDLTRAANLLRQLSNFPLLDARVIDVVIPAFATSVTQAHGMDRPHKGAAVIAQSLPSMFVSVSLPGTDMKRLTVNLASGMTVDTTVRLLVI
jgi:hypothetical protein